MWDFETLAKHRFVDREDGREKTSKRTAFKDPQDLLKIRSLKEPIKIKFHLTGNAYAKAWKECKISLNTCG